MRCDFRAREDFLNVVDQTIDPTHSNLVALIKRCVFSNNGAINDRAMEFHYSACASSYDNALYALFTVPVSKKFDCVTVPLNLNEMKNLQKSINVLLNSGEREDLKPFVELVNAELVPAIKDYKHWQQDKILNPLDRRTSLQKALA